jgi:hypothetical protein
MPRQHDAAARRGGAGERRGLGVVDLVVITADDRS